MKKILLFFIPFLVLTNLLAADSLEDVYSKYFIYIPEEKMGNIRRHKNG